MLVDWIRNAKGVFSKLKGLKMDSDFDYHMARSSAELDLAVDALDGAAEAHRTLAALHRARGETHRFNERLAKGTAPANAVPIFRTDKEA